MDEKLQLWMRNYKTMVSANGSIPRALNDVIYGKLTFGGVSWSYMVLGGVRKGKDDSLLR